MSEKPEWAEYETKHKCSACGGILYQNYAGYLKCGSCGKDTFDLTWQGKMEEYQGDKN